MDKENVYIHSGVQFNLKKERDSDICYNLDVPGECYAR
jgi:hypothetical protein